MYRFWVEKKCYRVKLSLGIFGDGKEPTISGPKVFENIDFELRIFFSRSSIYIYIEATLTQFFAQLYNHPDASGRSIFVGKAMRFSF